MRVIFALALAIAVAGCGEGGQSSSDDDAGSLLLLGAASFLDGWNQGRSPAVPMISTSCTQLGVVVNCVSY